MTDIPFDVAFCSTQERAIDTIHYILEGRTIEIRPLKGLREISFGDLEGEYAKDVFVNGNEYVNGYKEVGGENFEDATYRYLSTLETIAREYPDSKILIVSHGSMLVKVLGKLDDTFRKKKGDVGSLVPNCSLTKINYDGEFHVEYYSDIRYL